MPVFAESKLAEVQEFRQARAAQVPGEVAVATASIPGARERCAFMAAWTDRLEPPGARVRLYVASYAAADGSRLAEATLDLPFKMGGGWVGVGIDPAPYGVSESTTAFAIRTATNFIGGTFDRSDYRFDLLIDDGTKKLRSVLTRSTFDQEPRPPDEHEFAEMQEDVFLIRDSMSMGFHDILVKRYVTADGSSPESTAGKRTLKGHSFYRWNGERYVEQGIVPAPEPPALKR